MKFKILMWILVVTHVAFIAIVVALSLPDYSADGALNWLGKMGEYTVVLWDFSWQQPELFSLLLFAVFVLSTLPLLVCAIVIDRRGKRVETVRDEYAVTRSTLEAIRSTHGAGRCIPRKSVLIPHFEHVPRGVPVRRLMQAFEGWDDVLFLLVSDALLFTCGESNPDFPDDRSVVFRMIEDTVLVQPSFSPAPPPPSLLEEEDECIENLWSDEALDDIFTSSPNPKKKSGPQSTSE
jgi:hypothetical protein